MVGRRADAVADPTFTTRKFQTGAQAPVFFCAAMIICMQYESIGL
jgi:hypothetical protein